MFKRLGYIKDQLYDVEIVKSEIEHKGPIVVGLINPKYAKLRILELYFNFFDKCYDVTLFEWVGMVTDSLFLALVEHDFYDCIQPAMKKRWESLRSGDCTDAFSVKSARNFFPHTCCAKHKKHDRREPGVFKKELHLTEMICLCSKS